MLTAWDVATWLAVLVLGPGAVIVFVAFLLDLRRLLGEVAVDTARESAAPEEDR